MASRFDRFRTVRIALQNLTPRGARELLGRAIELEGDAFAVVRSSLASSQACTIEYRCRWANRDTTSAG